MTRLVCNNLKLDCTTKQLFIAGNALKAPQLTLRLLEELLIVAPEIVSIEQLISRVWQEQVIADETVTQRVALLRKLLRESGFSDDAVESIRHRGYRWCLRVDVEQQTDTDEAGVSALKHSRVAAFIVVLICFTSLYFSLFYVPQVATPETQEQAGATRNELLEQAMRYKARFDATSNQIAIDMFDKVYQQEPHNLQLLINYSVALSHQVSKFGGDSQDIDRAIELAEQATDIAPQLPEGWHALALAYDVQGDIDKSITQYQIALTKAPNNQYVKGDLSYLLMQKGLLAESLRLNYESFEGTRMFRHLQLAQNLWLLGHPRLAEHFFYNAADLFPDSELDTMGQVRFYLLNNQTQKALSLLDRAEKTGVTGNLFWLYRGLCQMTTQQIDNAIESLIQSLAVKPKQISASVLLYYLSPSFSDDNLAVPTFEPISQLNSSLWPEDAVYLGFLWSLRGENNAALEYLTWAFERGFRDKALLQFLPFPPEVLQAPSYLAILEDIEAAAASERELASSTVTALEDIVNRD